MDLDWSEYRPDWIPLDDEKRRTWTPEQVAIYDANTFRNFARRSPAHFAHATTGPPRFKTYDYIKLISDQITDLVEDKLHTESGNKADALFVTMPPRHGKSFLISEHTPAWYLTRYPNHQVLLTTYESDFAAGWGRKAKNIMLEHGPKFGLNVNPQVQANSRWELDAPFKGGMNTAGMGGPITGKGGHLLLGDDWVKGAEEANSKTFREAAWDWVVSVFLTRRQQDPVTGRAAKIILLMTRWHEDDPAGRLLRELPDSWATIEIPALSRGEDEDPLHRPKGAPLNEELVSLSTLHEMQRLKTYWFEALYQGRPTPEDGGMFSAKEFKSWRYAQPTAHAERAHAGSYALERYEGRFEYVPIRECRHFITADLAVSLKTHADWTVYSLWATTPNNDLLLVDRYRDKIDSGVHLDKLTEFVKRSGVNVLQVAIEDKTFGTSLIQQGRRFTNLPIRELKADQDKVTRALPASALAEAGRIFLPAHADWREEFISEAVVFPNGAHDDQVDTLAYAAQLANGPMRFRTSRAEQDTKNYQLGNTTEERLEAYLQRRQRTRRRAAVYARNRL